MTTRGSSAAPSATTVPATAPSATTPSAPAQSATAPSGIAPVRAWRPWPAALLVLAACASGAGGVARTPGAAAPPVAAIDSMAAADSTRVRVERLLAHAHIESIIDARGPAFTRQVALMAGDLTDPELERLVPAVTAAFAPSSLRADVVGFIVSDAPPGAVDEVLAFLDGGANAELETVVDGYDPPLSIDEFAAGLRPGQIPEERLDPMVDWTRAQGAGDFYVLVDQALDEASYTVLAELRPDTPPFEPASGEELEAMLASSFNAAVISFLHRFETVPTDLLRRATAEYASESGRWYVQAYSLAVARAIRAAAARVVLNLRA